MAAVAAIALDGVRGVLHRLGVLPPRLSDDRAAAGARLGCRVRGGVPFGILHAGKPMPEACGAIIASVVLGWLAMRTRSSWYGFAPHASIAITMGLLAVAHQV
jgi:membrane protease YdiL (CAAX protease family)